MQTLDTQATLGPSLDPKLLTELRPHHAPALNATAAATGDVPGDRIEHTDTAKADLCTWSGRLARQQTAPHDRTTTHKKVMTGAAGRREMRAIRRACPQEAIRRASIKPDDATDAAAAAATAAAAAAAANEAATGMSMLEVAAQEALGPVHLMQSVEEEEEEDELPQPLAPRRMNRREKNAVRRACPREGLRRASIRPDAMAHHAVIEAAIQAGRASAPAVMEGGSAVGEQRPQSPSRPHSADYSPRTIKAVRRVMPKKALSFRERTPVPTHGERKSESVDLTDLASLAKEHPGTCPQSAAFPA